MNSLQRVKAALNLKEPDRIPILELVIDPHVFTKIDNKAKDMADFCARNGLDVVCCNPLFKKIFQEGDYYKDEWGVLYKEGVQVINHPVKGPINSIHDLKRYKFPDPDAAHRLGNLHDMVKRYKGKLAIAFLHRDAFMWAAYLMGFENFLMSFYIQPKLAKMVMDMVIEVNEAIARNAIKAGADIVFLTDDYATNKGPFLPPELFKKNVLPYLQRMVDAVLKEGAYCVKHSDGNLWPIIDMIVDTGINGINPLEPAAGMDISLIKKKYGQRVCLIGNIDCGELLSNQTTVKVEEAVKKCIKQAGVGGGYIMSSSNSIHYSVKPKNFKAMISSTIKYGKYPLSWAN